MVNIYVLSTEENTFLVEHIKRQIEKQRVGDRIMLFRHTHVEIEHPTINKVTHTFTSDWSLKNYKHFSIFEEEHQIFCTDNCLRRRLAYKMKEIDMEASREYHKKYPPKVGNEVVVFNTMAGSWHKQHRRILSITDKGRLIVKHTLCYYAGISFWKSGQNCKAPTGQTWLVPIELYEVKALNDDISCKNICNFKKYSMVEKEYIDRGKKNIRQRLSLEKNKLSLCGFGDLNTGIRSIQIETRRKRVERKHLSLPNNQKLELETNKISLAERQRRFKVLKKGLTEKGKIYET